MKHIFIIRENLDRDILNNIVDLMRGKQYEIRYTKSLDDAKSIASEYNNCENVCRLYAIGGDGMVHNVINGMAGSNNELVVVPRGTGNDFARTIYKDLDAKKIISESMNKESHYIDLIKVNHFYCNNLLCCGYDAEIGNGLHDYNANSWLPKKVQYSAIIMRKLKNIRFFPTKIIHNDKVIFSGKTVICTFSNGRYYGGGFEIAKNASVTSGLIDINIIEELHKGEIISYLKSLYRQNLDNKEKYHHFEFDDVTIQTTQRLNVDGEQYEPGTYHLTKIPKALKLVF